jgi:hypothetical protein
LGLDISLVLEVTMYGQKCILLDREVWKATYIQTAPVLIS